jgi:hypothetical protein
MSALLLVLFAVVAAVGLEQGLEELVAALRRGR